MFKDWFNSLRTNDVNSDIEEENRHVNWNSILFTGADNLGLPHVGCLVPVFQYA